MGGNAVLFPWACTNGNIGVYRDAPDVLVAQAIEERLVPLLIFEVIEDTDQESVKFARAVDEKKPAVPFTYDGIARFFR